MPGSISATNSTYLPVPAVRIARRQPIILPDNPAAKRYPRHNSFFLIAFLCFLLTGCATNPPVVAEFALVATGKLAVITAEERFSARFNWAESSGQYRIDVWGPLGQGRVQLLGGSERIDILRGSQIVASGPVEVVMTEQLGWHLPVDAMSAWMRGEPLAGAPIIDGRMDDELRIVGFEQLGWTVRYEAFTTVPAGERPKRITASRGAETLRLVIAEWAG